MGRKSKLTESQWVEIERRVLEGESYRNLAKEFGVAWSTIRERVSAQAKEIKSVAEQIVSTEQRIMALPISAQITAQNLAAKLRAISDNLASAAHYGAMTAHRLSGMAHAETDKINETRLAESIESLKTVAALTKMANEASTIPLNLLAANKDTVNKINSPEEPDADDDARALAHAERLEKLRP